MPLLRCSQIEGTETVFNENPALLTIPNVIYVPHGYPSWGVYDHGGRLVPSCGYFRGPGSGKMDHELITSFRYDDITSAALDESYVYGGFIHGHYGHFLLSTLSRYWNFDDPSFQKIKIIYHSNEDIHELFKKSFISDLFKVMGLQPSSFIRFDEPTRIRKLIVPCTSFEETGFSYSAFSKLGDKLGDALVGDTPPQQSETPVYMSKARLAHGVGHLVNEEEFSEVLLRHGVDVVYPEQLSLSEQIALFRSRPIITALTGSSLHTSIFASQRVIIGLSYGNILYSSYTMIDRISGSRGLYFHPHEGIELLPRSAEFHLDYRLTDVNRTATEFLRAIDMAKNFSRERIVFRFPSGKAPIDPISWPNVAKDKPTRQSSFGPQESLATQTGYRSTATSGVLTGYYQFHTDHENQPWWDVDLLCPHDIFEIRLHNRSDNSQDRASRFVILISQNDNDWIVLHRQDIALTFGNGLEGSEFVWKSRNYVTARFVRIELLGLNFLHLDQIEVFGRSLSASVEYNSRRLINQKRPRFELDSGII